MEKPSFGEALRFWTKLGFISFGGPAGQISIMHTELVEKKKWIGEGAFLHALNFCMLLPGPEAQQLATYLGWLMHRTWGGVVAGVLFVLPSALLLWLFSWLYMLYGTAPQAAAVIYGLQPAVMAIVASAILRIGSKALKNEVLGGIAALAFIGLYFFKAPYVLIVVGAGLIGMLGNRIWKSKFLPPTVKVQESSQFMQLPNQAHPDWHRTLLVFSICLLIWWLPIIAGGLWQGWESPLFKMGLFFSKAALVTFGGAYAVLPYVAQEAVQNYQWLEASQMMVGMALAESTPGPLIMVLQFAGFVGGWTQHGEMSPLLSATLCAMMTTWATFAPSFLFIFVGAPYVERLKNVEILQSALLAITAAVVGVILNLALWFGIHTLFQDGKKIDFFATVVFIVLFLGIWRLKWQIIPVVFLGGLLGLIGKAFL